MKKIILALLVTCFVAVGCKNEAKDTKKDIKTAVATENLKETSFKISGMTCEVGCAKTIASKLSKQDGIVEANVVFKDSVATVKYDATKIDEKKIRTFVEGIGENTYKTCDVKCNKSKKDCSKKEKACKKECKCEGCDKLAKCGENCKNGCCLAKTEKKACNTTNCKKECCKKA